MNRLSFGPLLCLLHQYIKVLDGVTGMKNLVSFRTWLHIVWSMNGEIILRDVSDTQLTIL
jgi:hypothetical protein